MGKSRKVIIHKCPSETGEPVLARDGGDPFAAREQEGRREIDEVMLGKHGCRAA